MPELPEITRLAQQMDQALRGRTISGVEVLQPKCLNLPADVFCAALLDTRVQRATNRGKWVQVELDRGYLLINLGIGGEVLLTDRAALPKKHRLIIDFADGDCLAINFWWFGYAHFVRSGELSTHPLVSKLGRNVLDLTPGEFRALLHSGRGSVKALLLDQSKIAGIGNSYIHDILFLAGIHPLAQRSGLDDSRVDGLFQAMHAVLEDSLRKGTASYEMDLFGKKGSFTMEDIRVGYREGQPCPTCGTLIEKIKTGGTSSFICPRCQPR